MDEAKMNETEHAKSVTSDSSARATGRPPFQEAKTRSKRLKLLLWGDSGVGKTTQALQFPGPVMIDLEGGADLYGDAFGFHILKATTADEVSGAINWLLTHDHPYKTLIIDPITMYWDALMWKWSGVFLRRNKGTRGHKHELYDFQPKDWMTMKAELKDVMRKVIALDMNVVVTARQKPQYADGGFMQVVGETFDGEKSLPYMFDTIVRLYRDGQGRFLGECLKDRSNKLPRGEFECSYSVFEDAFGDALQREVKPVELATEGQKEEIRKHIEHFELTPEQVKQRLENYGVSKLDELTAEDAETILGKLHATLAARGEDHH